MVAKYLACSLGMALVAMSNAPAPREASDWDTFRQRFISVEGRVIDTGNQGISHSEGQGYALLLATHYRDRPTFERVLGWTVSHLQVRPDKLFAWKWTPAHGVEDLNDATDADVVIAWALLRAARQWSNEAWRVQAREITRDLRVGAIRRIDGQTVLLPGVKGFESPQGPVLNLSYWVYPALAAFDREDPQPEWGELERSGHALAARARFGRWGLPPDWLRLSEPLAPAPGFKAHFGYDAVRVPLYLLWGGASADELQGVRAFWGHFRETCFFPAWAGLEDDSVASYEPTQGIRAIADATMAYPNLQRVSLAPLDPQQDYYSSSLLLLTKMMLAECASR